MVDPVASNASYERVPTSGSGATMADSGESSRAAPQSTRFEDRYEFSVPSLADLWPRMQANAKALGPFLMAFAFLVVGPMDFLCLVIPYKFVLPVYFLWGLLLSCAIKMMMRLERRGNHLVRRVCGANNLLMKVVNFFVILFLSWTAAFNVYQSGGIVLLALAVFRERSPAGDVEAPETSDPGSAPTREPGSAGDVEAPEISDPAAATTREPSPAGDAEAPETRDPAAATTH